MTMAPPADPSADSEALARSKNSSKLVSQANGRTLLIWVLMILLPLALVRLALFFLPGKQHAAWDPAGLSLGLKSALQSFNTSDSSQGTECDLLHGQWVPDNEGPSYSNETCQHIQGHQNCLKNGRPDNGYMFWRWQPSGCELPRFDANLMMKLMRNKLLAFVGDSIARNQMQSMLCSLSQVERPVKTYTDEGDRHVRWWFPSSNFTLSTFWSPYLVLQTDEEATAPTESGGSVYLPKGTSQLHLDKLDPVWVSNITEFDAMVISSGQWFFKTNIFLINDTVVGCHHCESAFNLTGLGFYFAYGQVLNTILQGLPVHPDYHGITLLRSFSPDHFEDGRWDNGGSCKRTVPFASNTTVPEGSLTYEMHKLQVEAFKQVKSVEKMKMVDVTGISYLRPDGHPGPYRNFQPFSKEFQGYVQNDCLHWCIPGPVDTWNDMVLEELRRLLRSWEPSV